MAKANPLLELCRDDQLLAVHKPAGLRAGHAPEEPGVSARTLGLCDRLKLSHINYGKRGSALVLRVNRLFCGRP